jgi:hypothetical protein
MPACRDITYVLETLSWMRAERIWPNGQRYTWTDAFGVVLLVSLYAELGKPRFLDEAEWVVSDVEKRPANNRLRFCKRSRPVFAVFWKRLTNEQRARKGSHVASPSQRFRSAWTDRSSAPISGAQSQPQGSGGWGPL